MNLYSKQMLFVVNSDIKGCPTTLQQSGSMKAWVDYDCKI